MNTVVRRVATVMAAAALLLAGVACTSGNRDGGDGDGDGQSAAESIEIDSATALASSVHVEAQGCSLRPRIGGGGFVAPNLVLTVAHVVAGSKTITVRLPDGTTTSASLVAIDRAKDLAVLSVIAPQIDPVQVGTMQVGAHGAYVVLRDEQPVVQHSSTVSYVDLDVPGLDDDATDLRRGYQLDADVKRGDSGSLIISGGRVTAVIFATSTAAGGRAWATDATEANPLLQAQPVSAVGSGACA